MKKIACFAICLIATTSFAQTKSVDFVKKYNYKIEVLQEGKDLYDQSEYDKISYDYYVSKNNKESLLSVYYTGDSNEGYGAESNFFFKNNWMVPLSVNGISKTTTFAEYSASKIIEEGKTIAKIDRKGTINGLSCQYYAVLNDASNKEDYTYCFCIDETNKANNAESLFGDAKIKGLVLSVEMDSPMYRLVYKSSENANLKLELDSEKMIADIETYKENEATSDYETAVDSAAVAYEDDNLIGIYSDPLYSYTNGGSDNLEDYNLYNYISPLYSVTSNALYNVQEYYEGGTLKRENVAKFFEKESKSLVKNLASSKLITSDQKKTLQNYFKQQNKSIKSFKPNAAQEETSAYDDFAVATVDSVSAYDEAYDYYTKYESVYNDIKVEDEASLAYNLDTANDDSVKKYAPNYCEDLKNKIPNFQSKELKKHVYNLTGQICDLYLYNNGGNVDHFGTINQMRKSYLEIEKLRSGLSQKDQKALLEFLKSLD